MTNPRSPRSSFIVKFIECFLFAFAIFNVFNWLILKPVSLSSGDLKQMLPFLQLVLFVLVIVCALFILIYPIVYSPVFNRTNNRPLKRLILSDQIFSF